jgi:hypothetical protein
MEATTLFRECRRLVANTLDISGEEKARLACSLSLLLVTLSINLGSGIWKEEKND